MSNQEIENSTAENMVVAVDPGREKCGIAVVKYPDVIIHKSIAATKDIVATVRELAIKYKAFKVVVGNGTSSNELQKRLKEENLCEIVSIDEYRTTDMARTRYWQENPPRGWRRLLPVTMQVIPVPVDDYVAVILAEKYFSQKTE